MHEAQKVGFSIIYIIADVIIIIVINIYLVIIPYFIQTCCSKPAYITILTFPPHPPNMALKVLPVEIGHCREPVIGSLVHGFNRLFAFMMLLFK